MSEITESNFSVIKWVGASNFKSELGVDPWETVIENVNKAKAAEIMNDLAMKHIKAVLYENGVNISHNY